MTLPVDIAFFDTSSFSTIEARRKQSGNHQTFSIQYLKPVELNPLGDKLTYLNQFRKVQNNWDGYGAKAPNENAISNAMNFLKLLPPSYQKMLNLDEVNITPYGTVVMEWYKDESHFVSIEIGYTKIGFFSETPDGENPLEQSIEFTSNEVPPQVIPVFSKVFSRD